MNEKTLTVSYAPHFTSDLTTSRIMLDVLIALCPALLASVIIFGPRALLIVFICVVSCVVSEWAYEKATRKPVTIRDCSACVTGALLAYNLPVTIPLWQAMFGSAVAIIMVKQLFGGIGKNFANPAITGRVVMFLAFSTTMTTWILPPDGLTGATPLMLISKGRLSELPSLIDMILGVRGGCIGETSVVALVIGGAYLLIKQVIEWHTPVSFIGTVFILSAALGGQPVYQTLSGGLFLGAIFMATDYSTVPLTRAGRAVFGVGAGIMTVLIRFYGSYPEGVSFAILLMNTLVPLIDRLTFNKPLGGVKA